MAEFFDTLNDKHVEMIGKQPVFFVATAAADGRINLSPTPIFRSTAASPSCSAISNSRP
jgi:predicted pyridoxine 5'-phosphate oxidase superfamily flavin-nucleotide-binding protein